MGAFTGTLLRAEADRRELILLYPVSIFLVQDPVASTISDKGLTLTLPRRSLMIGALSS